jgi:ribonuclease HI
MRQKRRIWTRTIEKAKTTHWRQFLDEAGEGKLWKAATYMKPRDSWGCIPTLKVANREVTDNQEKAQTFMDSFFPPMAPAEGEPTTEASVELPWQPISVTEVYRSLRSAKGSSAPGEDGLPMLVWKRLWRHLGYLITGIFAASIELGYHPQKWRSACIVVLRKPGKPDYSLPGAYRPISLLNRLGKLLEAVMAKRLSYLAEHHGLLPDTQFGGRPGRTTELALLILTNAIDRAWHGQRVITLVAFDLKGAFNGVNQISLDACLQSKGIPTIARRWIASFMSGRQANIKFDDFSSEVAPLHDAGLAQGSPLSPILFAFFNCDLVDQPVDFHGGASAFIDDYFRWRIGRSAEENLAKIQSEDIPRIETWARKTGSSFAAEKTELIHITRKRSEQCQGQITMNDTAITPSTTAKLLGVVFDHELRWKEHVQQVVKRATKVNIALGGLRQLRPEQMRQLYEACVVPIVEYASTVWHDPLRDKTHLRHLRTVQRAALIRILSAFRTVATSTLEVEAHVLPTHIHLRHRAQTTITKLHTLPRKHPIWDTLLRAQRRRNNIGSYARFPLAEALKTMSLERLRELEMIDPTPLPPWRTEAFSTIEIEPDREIAIERAETTRSKSDIVVYSDASGHHGHLGAAAIGFNKNSPEVTESLQIQVGPMDRWSVHAAELIGILYAINLINKIALQRRRSTGTRARSATILSDSMSALQAIQNPRNKSGQQIIHAILGTATNTKTHGIAVSLQWVPGHSDEPGNEIADRLAKEAAVPGQTHPFSPLLSRERAHIRKGIYAQWESEWKESRNGSHLRKIDNSLPAKYTRQLYGNLPRNRAYLLTQLRTGHCWLSTYAKLFRRREDDRCVCGARESVMHVLLDCPALSHLRRELREKVGDALNNISTLLGVGGPRGGDTAPRAKTVEAILDFAEASQRFQSRAP